MPNYLHTMIFESGTYGWTESWYQTETTQNQAITTSGVIATTRARLLASDCRFVAYRISDVAITGDSHLMTDVQTYRKSGLSAKDTAPNSALIRVRASWTYRRPFMLRGLPDAWIAYGPGNSLPNPPATFLDPLKEFGDSLIAQQMKLKITPKPADPLDVRTVTSVALSATGPGTRMQLNANWGFGNGNLVKFSGFKGPLRKLNGRTKDYYVEDVDTITRNLRFGGLGAFVFGDYSSAKVTRIVPGYQSIDQFSFLDYRTRKTGRALFQSRGRSPKRV